MTLATLAELKGRLGITDTADDTRLTAHMQRIEDRMAAYCSREWALADRVETFTGPLGWLLLKAYPVVTLTSVELDGVVLTWTEDYTYSSVRGRVKYLANYNIWPEDSEMTVSYRGGYATAGTTPGAGETLPPSWLTGALLTQAEWEWRNKDVLGLKSASQSGVSVAAADFEWLPAVLTGMGPEKRFG